MISPASGISAYSTVEQISRPPIEQQPALPTEQKDAQGSGSVADKADISAAALALSKNVQSAGASSEQRKTHEGQPAAPQQAKQQSAPSIDIRV